MNKAKNERVERLKKWDSPEIAIRNYHNDIIMLSGDGLLRATGGQAGGVGVNDDVWNALEKE